MAPGRWAGVTAASDSRHLRVVTEAGEVLVDETLTRPLPEFFDEYLLATVIWEWTNSVRRARREHGPVAARQMAARGVFVRDGTADVLLVRGLLRHGARESVNSGPSRPRVVPTPAAFRYFRAGKIARCKLRILRRSWFTPRYSHSWGP